MASTQVFVNREKEQHGQSATLNDQFLIPERSVSHHHAVVEITDNGIVTITDLESRYGSFQVNVLSNDALKPGLRYIVGNKDVFYFGSCPVLFIIEAIDAKEFAHADAEHVALEMTLSAGSPFFVSPSSRPSPSTFSNAAHTANQIQPQNHDSHEFSQSMDNADAVSNLNVCKDKPSCATFPTPDFNLPDYIHRCTSTAQGFAEYLQDKSRQELLQKILRILVLVTDFFSVLLASMLGLLVPQECGRLNERKMCTLHENIDWYSTLSANCSYNLPSNVKIPKEHGDCFTRFNQFVLCWNFLLVACFAVLYVLENRREAWLGRYLDAEPSEIRDNLMHTKFWTIRGRQCSSLTRRLFYCYIVTFVVFIFNVIFSAMIILPKRDDKGEGTLYYNDGQGGYFLDYRTLTAFYAYTLPLLFKMVKGTYLLFCISLDKSTPLSFCGCHIADLQPLPWGLSTVDFEPTSFNVVAPEVCLKELGASDELVDSWQLVNPNGWRCPHVTRISPDERCRCTIGIDPRADWAQKGLIPKLMQGPSRMM